MLIAEINGNTLKNDRFHTKVLNFQCWKGKSWAKPGQWGLQDCPTMRKLNKLSQQVGVGKWFRRNTALRLRLECLLMHWWVKIQVFRNKIPNYLCISFIFSSFITSQEKILWEVRSCRGQSGSLDHWWQDRWHSNPLGCCPCYRTFLFLKKKERKKKKTRQNCFSGLLLEDWHSAWVHCERCYIPFSSTPWEFREQKKQRAMGTALSLVILMGFAVLMKFICSLILSNHIATNEADPTQGAVTVRSFWAWISEAKVNFSRQF